LAIREENLNVVLADLLAERGLKALGEVILKKGGKRPEPDVLLVINGVRIVIEGKKPGFWDELVKQCQERLDNNVCDLCVMVEYANIDLASKLTLSQVDVKNSLLKGKFNVGLMSYVHRAGLSRWMQTLSKPEEYKDIDFDELLTYLMSAYGQVVREDIIEPVRARMEETLREFSDRLATTVNVDRLKAVLELREKEEGDND
jgi:hypothetical protein